MKYILAFFVLISFSTLFAQEKYLIYFKDKGNSAKKVLSKRTAIEELAKLTLSERSINRRKKNCGNNFFTYDDIPLNKIYLTELNRLNVKIVNKLKWFNAVSAYLTEEKRNKLLKKSFIKKITKVKTLHYKKNTSEKEFNNNLAKNKSGDLQYDYGASYTQNQLSQIPAVHNLNLNGKGVIVGLLDAGFDWKNRKCFEHLKVITEHDFVNNDSVTNNGAFGHGTAVLSIIAGFDEGELVGPAFNAKFVLAKTEYVPTETHVEEDNYAAALEWMDSIGVDITSSSLGYSEFDKGEESYTYQDMDGQTTIVTKAAEKAFGKGILVITSAGNEGNKKWHYITAPADGINVVAVGAVNSDSTRASFSSLGPTYDGRIKPDVVAQGTNVYHESFYNEGYSFGSGTSYSAPIVAGIAAQLISAYPYLKNTQTRNILFESCNNVTSPNDSVGYGILNAISAVTYPNVENINGKYFLNKKFEQKYLSNQIWILYHYNYSDHISVGMLDSNENGTYRIEIPKALPNDVLSFAYEIKDGNNLIHREPEEGFYKWRYTEEDVHLNLNVPEILIIPTNYKLFQNFPNPFGNSTADNIAATTIQYAIPSFIVPADDTWQASQGTAMQLVNIKVYNILGQEVLTLVNEEKLPGVYTTTFDASGLASGIYFYRLTVKDFSITKKMIYLR